MKYRKLPVIVDAEVYKIGLEDGFDEHCGWYEKQLKENECYSCSAYTQCGKDYKYFRPYIDTLEGKHYITQGDYIITGVKGERYPCKSDVFAMTYEKVEGCE